MGDDEDHIELFISENKISKEKANKYAYLILSSKIIIVSYLLMTPLFALLAILEKRTMMFETQILGYNLLRIVASSILLIPIFIDRIFLTFPNRIYNITMRDWCYHQIAVSLEEFRSGNYKRGVKEYKKIDSKKYKSYLTLPEKRRDQMSKMSKLLSQDEVTDSEEIVNNFFLPLIKDLNKKDKKDRIDKWLEKNSEEKFNSTKHPVIHITFDILNHIRESNATKNFLFFVLIVGGAVAIHLRLDSTLALILVSALAAYFALIR